MNSWKVYLLFNSVTGFTYIGATTDIERRLRQHKREIKGGAKSTEKHCESWTLVCFLDGFIDKSSAMRWEKILKSRSRGIKQRKESFLLVAKKICPGDSKKKVYQVPDNIVLKNHY